MRDLVYLVVILAFFALATVFVAGCARIIGQVTSQDERR